MTVKDNAVVFPNKSLPNFCMSVPNSTRFPPPTNVVKKRQQRSW